MSSNYLLLNCMRQFAQTFHPEEHISIHSVVKLLSLYVNGGERGADSIVSQTDLTPGGVECSCLSTSSTKLHYEYTCMLASGGAVEWGPSLDSLSTYLQS